MKTTRITVAIYLLLLLVFSIPLQVVDVSSRGSRCVETFFLAVDEEAGKGIAMPVRICMEKGSGIEIHGVKYDESVLASFIVARYALATVCNSDIASKHIDIEIHGSGQAVKGASASLAFALALLQLENISHINTTWSATGVVSIDGFIDPVAGVSLKIEAAIEENVSRVYIPLLNSLPSYPPGVEIVELTSLLDLCRATIPSENVSSVDRVVLEKLYTLLRNETRAFLSIARELVDRTSGSLRRDLEIVYANMSSRIERALEEGHDYTAASLAFTLLLRVMSYTYMNTSIEELDKLIDEAKERFSKVLEKLKEMKWVSTSAIPFLIVVLDRVKEAQYYVDLYKEKGGIIPRANLVSIAVYAYGRSRTALTWFKLFEIANESSHSDVIPMDVAIDSVNRVLEWVAKSIEFNITYAPLSLTTLASTRAWMAGRLDRVRVEHIIETLDKLYRLHVSRLDDIQRIVPFFYYSYARDLGDEPSLISLTSLATLVAAATEIAVSLANSTAKAIGLPTYSVGIGLQVLTTLSIGIALALALTTLYVIEKGSSSLLLRRSTRSFTT